MLTRKTAGTFFIILEICALSIKAIVNLTVFWLPYFSRTKNTKNNLNACFCSVPHNFLYVIRYIQEVSDTATSQGFKCFLSLYGGPNVPCN